MNINTAFLRRCLDTLERALGELKRSDPDDIAYDIYRAACVKEFEIVLEQSGKLLRKRLSAYFACNHQADRLAFKDLFRNVGKRHFGPLPIVEGRGCDFPYQLRGKSLTATGLRRRSEESETRGDQQEAGSWESVEVDRIKIIHKDDKFEGTRLRHDSSKERKNHYLLEASYAEPGVEGAEPEVIHIEVSFLVQDNLSPRPIYESDEFPGRVAILYPKHRYQERTKQGIREYFILDSFIVDPDGVSSLRPHRLVLDGAEENYSIGREEQTGMFLLQIKEPRLVAPRPSPTQPNVMEETIALIASDEVNSSRIEVSIQKQATLEW